MAVKKHPTKGPDWWLICISHGRKGSPNYRPMEYVPFEGTYAEAVAYERELRGLQPDNHKRLKVVDMISKYFDWVKVNRSEKTYEGCQDAFRKLLPFLGNKYIAYLRNSDYEPYKAARLATKIIPKRRLHRKDRKHDSRAETDEQYAARCEAETRTVCKRTIQIELNHFRAFLAWCRDEERMQIGDLPKGFPVKQQKPKPKVVLSLEEIPILLSQKTDHRGQVIKAKTKTVRKTPVKLGPQPILIALMLQNGLRKTEALTLRKRNVDIKNNSLIITGKGNKTEVIPIITPELRTSLEALCEGKKRDDYLFVNPRTNRPYTKIDKSLKSVARAAGIEKAVTNHLMRHSFITGGIKAGVGVAQMQLFARHEDISTTQGYIHLHSDYLQAEAQKIASVMSVVKKPHKD
jgi:site-specific recombinase XerD